MGRESVNPFSLDINSVKRLLREEGAVTEHVVDINPVISAPNSVGFSGLGALTNWDIEAGNRKTVTLTGDLALTIINFVSGLSYGLLSITGNGHVLTINGVTITLNATGKTLVGAIHDGFGWVFNSNAATAAPVSAVPTITGRVTLDTTHLNMLISKAVTSTIAGWSFKKNGSTLVASAIAGSNSSTLTFAIPTITAGDTILVTYDSTVGDCKDSANNPLASFVDQPVTNNLSAGSGPTQLGTPTLNAPNIVSSSEVDNSWSAIANSSSYVLQSATDLAFTENVVFDYNGSLTSHNTTSLVWGVKIYWRVKAVGNGTTFSDSNWSTPVSATPPPPFSYTGPGAALNFNQVVMMPDGFTPEISQTNGVWGTPNTNGNFGNTGSNSTKLPSGTSGSVGMGDDNSDIAGAIGFTKVNGPTNIISVNMIAGFWITNGNAISIAHGGTTILSVAILPVGTTHTRLFTDGAGMFKVQASTDGGNTWAVDVYTIIASGGYVGDMWAGADIYGGAAYKLVQPFKMGF